MSSDTPTRSPGTSIGDSAPELDSSAIVPGAPLTAVGMEKDMPRRRYQRGMLTIRGKRRRKWIGTFREDRFQPDGTIRRVRRKLVLGVVKNMTKLEAIQALQ